MYILCLDTCTWINIANGTEPVRFLEFIAEEIDTGNIDLIVPETVILEWNRNKEETVDKGTIKHFSQVFESLERIKRILGNKGKKPVSFLFQGEENDGKEYFEDLVKKLKEKKDDVQNSVRENIERIDHILSHSKTVRVEINDRVRLLAGEHALAKKAPFFTRNGYADALIFFSFIDFLRENGLEKAFFITYNTDDFCLKENGKKWLHPDLKPYMHETKSEFFTIVGEALKQIEEDITTKEELKLIEELQNESNRVVQYCPACMDEDNYSELYFSEPFEIYNAQSKHGFNPNQLSLPFKERLSPPSRVISINTIQAASCEFCGAEYFICQNCKTTNAVDDRYNETIECEGCNIIYMVKYSDQDYEYGIRPTYIIPGDERICQTCGSNFEYYGVENGMCKKCEDEHLTS